jgi:hypothetical protein
MSTQQEIAEIANQFQVEGDLVRIDAIGSGHIHDTYRLEFARGSFTGRVVLQHINRKIFCDVPRLMENIQRVSAHRARQLTGTADASRRGQILLATRAGAAWYIDAQDEAWRMFSHIDGTRTYDTVESVEQAYQAARAFGRFQQQLATLPPPRLHDTIPGFHDTPRRFAALEQAIAEDRAGRVAASRDEIDFVLARKPLCGALLHANLPERVTHNDTKLNNVLFDEETGEGLCVIDLDTVMPGLALYDFGDMVRTTTCTAAEDERDLTLVHVRADLFEALVCGYLEATRTLLNEEEKRRLVDAGMVIIYEQAIRFLADHLCGDTYYKVHREGQNLDRCRMQLKLLASVEEQESELRRMVDARSKV